MSGVEHSAKAYGKMGSSPPKSSAYGLNKTMGTTAMSKVSLGSASNKCPTEASVSFVDYLPNSIVRSPQRRAFSHSNVTQRLGINKVVRTNVMV